MTVEREKQCAVCGEFKPISSFKRLLTLSQTQAALKQPNATTRFTTESKNCKACRLKAKRKTPYTTKEIRRKVASGDIHPIRGEMLLRERSEALPAIRSRGAKKRWEKAKSAPLKALKKRLQKQVAKYASRYHTYKHNHPDDPHNDLLAQHRYNYSQAKQVRDKLIEQAEQQLAQGKPISIDIDAEIGLLINPRFMTQYLINEGEPQ